MPFARPQSAWLPAGDDHLLLTAALHHDDRGLAAWRGLRPRFVLESSDDEQSRLLPLVLRTLTRNGATDPDFDRMLGLRRYGWIRSMIVSRMAAEAIGAMQHAGIDVMILKGMVLSSTVYDDPALRSMVDADVLVRPADVPEADRVLRSLGYDGRSISDRRYLVMRHGLDYTRADEVEVDVHWMPHRAMAPPGISGTFPLLAWEADLQADEWWDRTRTISVGDVSVLAPSSTDVLLHVCLHGGYGGSGSRLRWVADAAALLRVEGAQVDWDGLVSQAARRGAGRTLADAFRYLGEDQDLPVPQGVVDELAALRARPRGRIADRWSTRPLPRRRRFVGYLPNTTVRYLLLTRQDPAGDAIRAAPRFLAAAWGVEDEPRAVARAVVTKVRSRWHAQSDAVPGHSSR